MSICFAMNYFPSLVMRFDMLPSTPTQSQLHDPPYPQKKGRECLARPGRMQRPGGGQPRFQEKRPCQTSSLSVQRHQRAPALADPTGLYTRSTSLHLAIMLLAFLLLAYAVGADPLPLPSYVCLLVCLLFSSLPAALPPPHTLLPLSTPQRYAYGTHTSRTRLLGPDL
jgi:hypothetical protein